nr:hypothetical protein [Tanacetum cinerariifolium]
MLKLHRENVNEMQIAGYDFDEDNGVLKKYDKITDGRKSFVVMKTEFEAILIAYRGMNKKGLDKESFAKCYDLFFSGLELFKKKHPGEKDFAELLEKAKQRHHRPEAGVITSNEQRKYFINGANL